MAITWINLTEINQVDASIENSNEKSIVFFKHSTRCIVSRHVLLQLEKEWNFNSDSIAFYFLDLLNHRDVSNYISDTLGVYHQSPQIVVIKNKAVIYSASHEGITAMNLHQKIN
jgi:bacillithiol system protein YtxJ